MKLNKNEENSKKSKVITNLVSINNVSKSPSSKQGKKRKENITKELNVVKKIKKASV